MPAPGASQSNAKGIENTRPGKGQVDGGIQWQNKQKILTMKKESVGKIRVSFSPN